jgi:hypothetical protein
MQIKEVSASFAYTKNMGNYESMRAESTVTAQIEPGEEPGEVSSKCFEMAKDQVRVQIKTGKEAVK